MGPSVWLGRAWFSDPVKNYDPDHPKLIQGALSKATKPLANATLLALSEAIGLQGMNANDESSGGNYTTPVGCLFRLSSSIGMPRVCILKDDRTWNVACVTRLGQCTWKLRMGLQTLSKSSNFRITGE